MYDAVNRSNYIKLQFFFTVGKVYLIISEYKKKLKFYLVVIV